jgi:hypothetical protein
MTDALQIARLDRATAPLIAGTASGRKSRQLRRRAARAIGAMSLDAYVAWLNRDGGSLIGADAWRARGVTTAAALGRILDAEHRRNVEKSERYGDDD